MTPSQPCFLEAEAPKPTRPRCEWASPKGLHALRNISYTDWIIRNRQLTEKGGAGVLKGIPPRVKLVIFALSFNEIAVGYLTVYLTAYFPELSISPGVVGFLVGLQGLVLVIAGIPLGILSDRIGRRPLLLFGTLVSPPAILVFAYTTNLALLASSAILLGLAESAALSSWNALIADQTDGANRVPAYSLSFIVSTVSMATGSALPVLIPVIRGAVGLDSASLHKDIFVLVGVAALVTPVMMAIVLRGYHESSHPTRLGSVRGLSVLAKFSVSNGMIGLGAGFIIPLIPTWLYLKFGVPDAYSGPLLALSSITIALAALVSSKLSAKYGPVRAIVAAQGLSTVFMLSLAFIPNAAVAAGIYIVRAMLMNMSSPILDSYLMSIVPKDQRGLASSINSLVWRLPNSASTIVGGLLLGLGRYDLPFYIATAFYVAAISLFYVNFRNVTPTN